MLTQVYQPVNSKLCGQACIATLLGITLEQACLLVGHERATSTKRIAETLTKVLNYPFAKKLKCGYIPNYAIVKIRWWDRTKRDWYRLWHFVLIWNGKLYDPYPWEKNNPAIGCFSSYISLEDWARTWYTCGREDVVTRRNDVG